MKCTRWKTFDDPDSGPRLCGIHHATNAVGFAGDEPENPILVAVESPRMHDRSNAEGATIDSFIGSTANVFVHSKFCPHR